MTTLRSTRMTWYRTRMLRVIVLLFAAVTCVFGQTTIAANPESIEAGASVTLTWSSDATTAFLDGIGAVPPSGSTTVSPRASSTYTLVTQGVKGIHYASVRVEVTGERGVSAFPDPDDFPRGVSDRRNAIRYTDFLDVTFRTLQDGLKFRVRGDHLPRQNFYVFFTDREPRPEFIRPSDRGIRSRRVAYLVRVEEPRSDQAVSFEVKAIVEYQRAAEAKWRPETDQQIVSEIASRLKEQLLTAKVEHP
jgi:hypothetical protein